MLRRTFVNNCLLITTGLVTGCTKSAGSKVVTNRLIKGRVTSLGKGIAGVLVSDGLSIVSTNDDGGYQIIGPSTVDHVFVIVPAGYEFLHDKHIARHFISTNAYLFKKFDFELTPLSVDDDQHRFVIWADPQIQDNKDVKKLLAESVPDLQQYKQSLPAGSLIHGITVGDVVDENMSLFKAYNEAVSSCGIPFFQVVGNHDLVYGKGEVECYRDFANEYGPLYYSFNRGKAHYIMLNNVFFTGPAQGYRAFIDEQQMNWLRKNLEYVSKDKLIILCLHIPANWLDNKKELFDVLKGYNVHIMSGHTHYNDNYVTDNIYEHVHGAVCGAWWTGPICIDGTPCGYAIYEVDGTDLKWQFKSIGHDSEFQIRTNVYKVNGQTIFQANVWNYDPKWKVEYWTDGTYRGILKNYPDFDHLAVQLYKGEQMPNNKSWVEPRTTNHLFTTPLPANTAQVKILVTDRFGKTYETVTQV